MAINFFSNILLKATPTQPSHVPRLSDVETVKEEAITAAESYTDTINSVTFSDTESDVLPSLDSETIQAKLQEFYSLCKWLKNNMLTPIGIWPRMVLAFMNNGNVIAALNATTELGIEPLTDADRAGWEITLDNSAQGEGAQGILRLVYTSDTEWYVEGKAWYEGNFSNVLQYSANALGYEMVGGFDGNGGTISISGDLANSSVAKVLNPESQFVGVDFLKLVNEVVVNIMSNQTISGIKTFLYPPQVPMAYNDADAASKKYVDDAIAAALGNIQQP